MFKRWGLRGVGRLALPMLMIAALAACGGGDDEGEGQGAQAARGGRGGGAGASIPVEVTPVERGDIAATLLTYTSLEAERLVDVIARTQGLVKILYVEEGDRVTEGQPLAQLDTDVLKLTLQEREVSMNSLEATFKRAQELVERELLSSQEFEQTRFQYEGARTQYESAKLQLEYATIRSPFSGIVTERLIEIGNLVANNQAVFRTADFDPLLARIFVPEKDIRQVKLGQTVRINIEGAEETFTGKVRMISPIVDPASGTIKVTVEIRDRTRTLRPGMFTTVNLITAIHKNAMRIEKKALVAEAEGIYVFLFKGGRAEKKRIETGFSEGNMIEVPSGLTDNDSIITVGQEGLRNGAPVRIVGQAMPVVAEGGQGGPPTGMHGGQGGEDQRSANMSRGQGGEDQRQPGRGQGEQGGPPAGIRGGQMMSMDLGQMKERLFNNPQVKEAYDKKVKEDPEFAKDEEKQRAFFRETMMKMRGNRGAGGRPQE